MRQGRLQEVLTELGVHVADAGDDRVRVTLPGQEPQVAALGGFDFVQLLLDVRGFVQQRGRKRRDLYGAQECRLIQLGQVRATLRGMAGHEGFVEPEGRYARQLQSDRASVRRRRQRRLARENPQPAAQALETELGLVRDAMLALVERIDAVLRTFKSS